MGICRGKLQLICDHCPKVCHSSFVSLDMGICRGKLQLICDRSLSHTLGQWPVTYKLELASTYTHVQWDKWGVTHLGTGPITYKLELASTYTHVQWDKWGVTHLGTVTSHISWSLPLHIPMSNETNEEWLTLGQRPITYKLELALQVSVVTPHLSHWTWVYVEASSNLYVIGHCPNETNEEWHTLGQRPITYKLELASTYTHVQWDKWGVTHLGTVTYHI